MLISLKDRVNSYKEISDIKLLPKLPIIVQLNGRSFSKATSLLEKPFSEDFSKCMSTVLFNMVHEIDGCIFGFSFNDKIILVLRNDQSNETEPWYDNKIQKMASATAGLATSYFLKCSKNLDLLGNPIFISQCFVVPNITEAINSLINYQQEALYSAISLSVFYELIKIYDIENVKQTLNKTSIEDKLFILKKQTDVDFNEYPASFRNGMACYRIPKLIPNTETFKNKWIIDLEIPIFTKEHSFLRNIFKL